MKALCENFYRALMCNPLSLMIDHVRENPPPPADPLLKFLTVLTIAMIALVTM